MGFGPNNGLDIETEVNRQDFTVKYVVDIILARFTSFRFSRKHLVLILGKPKLKCMREYKNTYLSYDFDIYIYIYFINLVFVYYCFFLSKLIYTLTNLSKFFIMYFLFV